MYYILFTSAGFPEGNASSVYINNFLRGLMFNNRFGEVFLLSSNKNKTSYTDYGVKYTYLSGQISNSATINRLVSVIFVSYNIFTHLIKVKKKNKNISILIYNNRLLYNVIIHFLSYFLGTKTVSFVPEYYEKPKLKDGINKIIQWYGFYFNLHLFNRLSSKLIVFSYYLKYIYQKKGMNENKIFVQPNLTDFDFWKTEQKEIKYDIGYSGSAVAKDGLIHLFNGIKELKNRNIFISALIIGDLPYGPSVLPSLKKYCKDINILDQITFTGLIPHKDVKEFLSQCEYLILPRVFTKKTQAGFPTKLGEYFACEKLIISSNFGDIEKYFSNNNDLILISNLEASTIADSIIWLKQNPIEAKNMIKSGYEKAFEVFDYKHNTYKIIYFIEN